MKAKQEMYFKGFLALQSTGKIQTGLMIQSHDNQKIESMSVVNTYTPSLTCDRN